MADRQTRALLWKPGAGEGEAEIAADQVDQIGAVGAVGSTQPILDAANAVIAQAREGFSKTLTSSKLSAELPHLVTVEDEMAQAVYVADQVLEHREAGIDLRHQAVLFRTSHHSGRLEIELAGRNIPFVKYGGLKFIEAAHVKDLLAILRWAENPRDALAGFRVLQLLPGIGPARAKKAMTHLGEHRFDLGEFAGFSPRMRRRCPGRAFAACCGVYAMPRLPGLGRLA